MCHYSSMITHAITESPLLGGRGNWQFLSHEPSSKDDSDFSAWNQIFAWLGGHRNSGESVKVASLFHAESLLPPARSFPRLPAAYCRGFNLPAPVLAFNLEIRVERHGVTKGEARESTKTSLPVLHSIRPDLAAGNNLT